MKNINVGIINLIISERLKRGFFNDDALNENVSDSEIPINIFFETIKSSPILQTEFTVMSNLEKKHIDNELGAVRYIDNNIKLFEIYTLEEVLNERKKLKPFFNEEYLNSTPYQKKIKLYESINNLIIESLKDYENIDVDGLHESFDHVLNFIKTKKENTDNLINETIDLKNINESIIKIAVTKFNEKYKNLSEEERGLLNNLIMLNEKEKENLFKEEKNACLLILENIEEKHLIDRKHKALDKIKSMNYNKNTIDGDLINLFELKKGLN